MTRAEKELPVSQPGVRQERGSPEGPGRKCFKEEKWLILPNADNTLCKVTFRNLLLIKEMTGVSRDLILVL